MSDYLISPSELSRHWVSSVIWDRPDASISSPTSEPLSDLSALSDAEKYLEVHVDEAYEGQDSCGEGGVPDQGQRVPEDEVRVPSGFWYSKSICRIFSTWLSHIGAVNISLVLVSQGHLKTIP